MQRVKHICFLCFAVVYQWHRNEIDIAGIDSSKPEELNREQFLGRSDKPPGTGRGLGAL